MRLLIQYCFLQPRRNLINARAMPGKKRKSNADTTGSSNDKISKTQEPNGGSAASPPSSSSPSLIEKCSSPATLTISSWNVNGIRAWQKKNGLDFLINRQPDILMVQEVKCEGKDMPDSIKNVPGYESYWESSDSKAGYAGVGLYSKIKPIDVKFGLGNEDHDKEGRLITAEYDQFYVVGAYVPNSGRGLPRLAYRTEEWDVHLTKYLKDLDSKKPVVFCGDLNVAHKEIDLANPKSNAKTAGFTKEERQGFTNLLKEGFVDSYRALYPHTTKAYTFWSYMGNARGKNVGWRLDYFVVSERLMKNVCDNEIHSDIMGSDHCPLTLSLAME